MRYNTLIKHRMLATYHPWKERVEESNGLIYRDYGEEGSAEDIRCTLIISMVGNMQLLSDEELQGFAIVNNLRDVTGTPITDRWYTIQRVQPVMDASGSKTSFRHNLAEVTGEEFERALNPTADWPFLDMPSYG